MVWNMMKIAMNLIINIIIYKILNLNHIVRYIVGGVVYINKNLGYVIAELVTWEMNLLLCLVYLSAKVTN